VNVHAVGIPAACEPLEFFQDRQMPLVGIDFAIMPILEGMRTRYGDLQAAMSRQFVQFRHLAAQAFARLTDVAADLRVDLDDGLRELRLERDVGLAVRVLDEEHGPGHQILGGTIHQLEFHFDAQRGLETAGEFECHGEKSNINAAGRWRVSPEPLPCRRTCWPCARFARLGEVPRPIR
jgi:hypothetical protein